MSRPLNLFNLYKDMIPSEAEQTNLNGFLPSFYRPDYVSNCGSGEETAEHLLCHAQGGQRNVSVISVTALTSKICISGLHESGGIPHLFRAPASPYRWAHYDYNNNNRARTWPWGQRMTPRISSRTALKCYHYWPLLYKVGPSAIP